MWRLIVLLLVAIAGLWFGKIGTKKNPKILSHINPDKEYPLAEHKSFVIVVYAHNQANWCKRVLHSIFEQDYDHYRIVMIDDASIDGTEQISKEFIVENNQDEKVIFIRNENFLGPVASLYRIVDNCLDREMIIPLDAKDWFTSPNVLNQLNFAFQNPDVWIATGRAIEYPTYKIQEGGPICCYVALLKQLCLTDPPQNGGGHVSLPKSYLKALEALSGGRIRRIEEPLGFFNASSRRDKAPADDLPSYRPLASFPESKKLY